ncbi:hypothetical protein ACH5RR_023690 [Cinchona calisaya]|uniref:Chromo domain-containing protein n=1 Tax=Cinchona calisaya TaxID=153742 RepID=A0ABD2ZCI0_9GENT
MKNRRVRRETMTILRRSRLKKLRGKKETDGDDDGDERPKLAEGFYEIEAIRRKRVRKKMKGGQVQYLIKCEGGWRQLIHGSHWEIFYPVLMLLMHLKTDMKLAVKEKVST